MRVLLVAPANPAIPDISAAVQAIAQAHDCAILHAADTTQREIVEKATAATFDIIWLFGHLGGGGGLALAEGELSTETIVSIINVACASLAVLTVCRSWQIAQEILARTQASVIHTPADTFAADAMLVSIALARRLAAAPTYREAFEQAAPGNLYLYSGNYRQHVLDAIAVVDSAPSSQLDRLYAMTEQIRRDIASVDRAVAVLEQSVTQLQRDVRGISGRLSQIEGRPNTPHMTWQSWAVVLFAMFMVLIAAGLWFGLGTR